MTAPEPTAAADLVAALAELEEPAQDGHVRAGQRDYRYATLTALLGAVRPVLGRHRIAVRQSVEHHDARVSVVTTLVHASGHEWPSPPLELPSGRDAQSVGSASTYARRYSLAAAVGIGGGIPDTDAADVTQAPAAQHRTPDDRPRPDQATPEQLERMTALLDQLDTARGEPFTRDERRAMVAGAVGRDLERADDLTRDEAAQVIATLEVAHTVPETPEPAPAPRQPPARPAALDPEPQP